MKVRTCVAGSLAEYVNCIHEIKNNKKNNNKNKVSPPTFWFRAQPDIDYPLLPTLMRKEVRVGNSPGNYSPLHYAEDIRTQHYIAKKLSFFFKSAIVKGGVAGGYAASQNEDKGS